VELKGLLLLKITDLSVETGGKTLLRGVNLSLKPGEVHVIFGPNGSGKSSLLHTIMGLPNYRVISGDIEFMGKSILGLGIAERAKLGIGLAFQRPPVVPGVSLKNLTEVINPADSDMNGFADELNLRPHLDRYLNDGFSGGEMKRSEILQLLLQNPDLVMLDEPESGVDVANVDLLAKVIKKLLQKDMPICKRSRGGILVTHTGNILEEINADRGYVMLDGKIVCSGCPLEIFEHIKKFGFERCYMETGTIKGETA